MGRLESRQPLVCEGLLRLLCLELSRGLPLRLLQQGAPILVGRERRLLLLLSAGGLLMRPFRFGPALLLVLELLGHCVVLADEVHVGVGQRLHIVLHLLLGLPQHLQALLPLLQGRPQP